MESSSLDPLSSWDYVNLLILRPILAISFVILFIALWWVLAWKVVLVHVSLVQEIFGLRKKPAKPKPPTRRFSRYYNSLDAENPNPLLEQTAMHHPKFKPLKGPPKITHILPILLQLSCRPGSGVPQLINSFEGFYNRILLVSGVFEDFEEERRGGRAKRKLLEIETAIEF